MKHALTILTAYLERALEALAYSRDALAATLFLRAENLASQLHDDSSLVPAWLRYYRAFSLISQGVLAMKAAKGTPREDA